MKHNNQIKRNTLTRWQKPSHKKQKNEDDNFSSPEQNLVYRGWLKGGEKNRFIWKEKGRI
jgi:hypothetical protein